MGKVKKIFVVIDPTSNNQYALHRAGEIAQRRKSEIIAHLCIYSKLESSNLNELKDVEIERHKPWLEKHLKLIRDKGIKVDSEIVWDANWHHELGKAVKKAKPDLIVKTSRRNLASKRLKMLTSDWALFESAVCPVMLVNSELKSTGKILSALNFSSSSKKYKEIMKLVIVHSKAVADSRNAELHIVSAYIDPDDYVHVTDVAKKVGIPSENVHVIGAQPEQAIVQVANEINAEMVIMGLSTKSKLASRVFGYTSEWLLNNLAQDIFVIIPKKS
jgi:universal stress protein E